ncbi:lipopolysaccharide biosynthesis protein [Thiomonas sp.]|uniref:lipopolysaccharide biosynthesis protein n=1 Tax=Thiomonas sp. TaxID=2047785 RepID=UPI0026094F11|nr:oligosaccharide flippase family protein [Thiomonas sp.]
MSQGDPSDASAASRRESGGALMRLLRHTSNYSVGTVLITVASVVSFPVFTRLFTVEEYGVLGLVNATLAIVLVLGKLGLQQSVVRFHAEIEAGRRAGDRVSLFSTVFFSMLGVGALATALSAALFLAVPHSWWGASGAQYLAALAAPLILIRVLDSAMLNLMRAEQRSGLYSLYTVSRKYVALLLVLATLFAVSRSLWGFFVATIVGEGVAVSVIIVHYARQGVFVRSRFSRPLFAAMLGFGLPLLISEMSTQLLNVGGRYIINYQLGATALGSYSAAYNFCDYLQAVLTGAFAQAVVPMYLRMWESQGQQRTEEFLQQALRYYLLLAVPVVAGMAAVAPDMLRLLASDRYAVGAPLFVFIVGGMLVAGGSPIFSAGIYIRKLTRVVMYSVLAAATLNLGLTAVLLRSMGIEGAALATLASYVLFSACTAYFGRRAVRVRMPWRELLLAVALSLLMYAVVSRVRMDSVLLRIVARALLGVLVYGGLLLLVDPAVRRLARAGWQRLSARLG